VYGTIIEADVKASSNYDKDVFDVTKVVLKGGAAFAALKGAWVGEGRVRRCLKDLGRKIALGLHPADQMGYLTRCADGISGERFDR
jgi:hypothetical protein